MKLKPIKIVNIKDAVKSGDLDFQYAGRANPYYDLKKSPLANPFKDGSRKEMVNNFKLWLYHVLHKEENSPQKQELRRLYKLWLKEGELKIACWCFPLHCHVEIIKELLETKAIAQGYEIDN